MSVTTFINTVQPAAVRIVTDTRILAGAALVLALLCAVLATSFGEVRVPDELVMP
jgi:hypothetical protein